MKWLKVKKRSGKMYIVYTLFFCLLVSAHTSKYRFFMSCYNDLLMKWYTAKLVFLSFIKINFISFVCCYIVSRGMSISFHFLLCLRQCKRRKKEKILSVKMIYFHYDRVLMAYRKNQLLLLFFASPMFCKW